MTPEEYRAQGHDEAEIRAFTAGYNRVVTGDRLTMRTADMIETRGADPYTGLDGPDLQAALNTHQASEDGLLSAAEMTSVLGARRTADQAEAIMRVAEVIRPGGSQLDTFDREQAIRRQWAERVGRWFSAEELRGLPRAGCEACARMAGAPCDQHVRRMGEPIALPDHPWPSEMSGHTPGMVVLRPGAVPYRLDRSVA